MDIPQQSRNTAWWRQEGDEALSALWAFYEYLLDQDQFRLELLYRHIRLYGNQAVNEYGMPQYQPSMWSDDRIRLNVIKSACDTVIAKVGKNRPKPKVLTSGGNWSMRRKAKFLEKFFSAQFSISKVYAKAPEIFKDACVTGTGVAKVYGHGKKICFERVFPGEVFVDELDGLYAEPQTIVQRKYIDRAVLLDQFPEHKDGLLMASRTSEGSAARALDDSAYQGTADMLCVLEAWRLPSSPEAGDGKHVIAVENTLLVEEEWDHESFPFIFVRWSTRMRGFWGMGLAEELSGIQVEINRILQKIQASMNLASVPRVFLQQGSKVTKSQINNRIGQIIYYAGNVPPVFHVAQSVHPEMLEHLDRLYARAFEIAGISMLSAASQKPSGLQSGIALRTFHDIETERFAIVAREYETMYLEAAKHLVRVAKDLGGSVAIQEGRFSIDQVKWSEIDLEEDAYIMHIQPASSLPSDPAGRLAFVEEMLQAGLMSPEVGQELLDFPDLDAHMSLERAASDNIDRIIEKMLDEDYYEAPEPFMDLQLAIKKSQAAYNKALSAEDIPDTRLEALREFMSMCNELMIRAQADQQPQMGPAEAGAPPPNGPDGVPPTAPTGSDGVALV